MCGGKRVGHTGTLDPLASGVLPLVLGKATRLAQFLSGVDKEYIAGIALGTSTTTFDRTGTPLDVPNAAPINNLTRDQIDAVVGSLTGRYLQTPPSFSAKKIDGDRAYDLARRNQAVQLEPVEVTAVTIDVLEWSGADLRVRIVCSAGFYVRSLAQAIGERLGTGAHLASLTRTRSGEFSIDSAVSLETVDRRPEEAAAKVVPLAQLLPGFPAISLTPEGAALAARGGFLGGAHLTGSQGMPQTGRVRLLHPDGHLVAIAEARITRGARVLHPGVVLE